MRLPIACRSKSDAKFALCNVQRGHDSSWAGQYRIPEYKASPTIRQSRSLSLLRGAVCRLVAARTSVARDAERSRRLDERQRSSTTVPPNQTERKPRNRVKCYPEPIWIAVGSRNRVLHCADIHSVSPARRSFSFSS